MLLHALPSADLSDRVRRTVELLHRRGFAVGPVRLGALCLSGAVSAEDVRIALAELRGELVAAGGLIVPLHAAAAAPRIEKRAQEHDACSRGYVGEAVRFAQSLVWWAPFIRGVAIAGSLSSGGFRESDDVDLNLIVDDGHRHLAYFAVNALGAIHALGHRHKPVDDLTRRPLAPRLMTANLILERSQCRPLVRTDEDMAFELLMSRPVVGAGVFGEVLDWNPKLLEHFPQLDAMRTVGTTEAAGDGVPQWIYPAALDGLARIAGEAGWRFMQWTRRDRPEALARVAFVRSTMRPYTLFDHTPGAS